MQSAPPDDFETAVLCHFSQGAIPREVREQAVEYCRKVAEDPVAVWEFAVTKLFASPFAEVQFFCLQLVQDVIMAHLARLDGRGRAALRAALLALLERGGGVPAVRNKLAQTVALLCAAEWPHAWPDAFDALAAAGARAAEPVLRVLLALDELVASAPEHAPRSPATAASPAALRDLLRATALPPLCAWCAGLAAAPAPPHAPDQPLLALRVLEALADWADVAAFTAPPLLALLQRLLRDSPSLRAAAAGVLAALLARGMDAPAKLELLARVRTQALLGPLLPACPLEAVAPLAALAAAAAEQLLAGLKALRLFPQLSGAAAAEAGLAPELLASLDAELAETMHVITALLPLPEAELGPPVLGFVGQLLHALGRAVGPLPPPWPAALPALLAALAARVDWAEARDSLAADEAAEPQREQLRALFRAVARLAPDLAAVHTAARLREALQAAPASPPARPRTYSQPAPLAASDRSTARLRGALVLLHELGQGIPDEVARTRASDQFFAAALRELLVANCFAHRDALVAQAAFECAVRYPRALTLDGDELLAGVLAAFIDERGLRAPAEDTRRRLAPLFLRLVKALRPRCAAHLDALMVALADALQLRSPAAPAQLDLQLQLIEAVGSLISARLPAPAPAPDSPSTVTAALPLASSPSFSPARGSLLAARAGPLPPYAETFLAPHMAQLSALLAPSPPMAPREEELRQRHMSQLIQAFTAFSKGFTSGASDATRQAFHSAFGLAVAALERFPASEELRFRCIGFAHRMADRAADLMTPAELASSPHLPRLCVVLINATPSSHAASTYASKDLCEFVKLLNQVLGRSKEAMLPLINLVLMPLICKIIAMYSSFAGGTLTEHDERERSDLHKAYLLFLQNVLMFNCGSVFFTAENLPSLDEILKSLASVLRQNDYQNIRTSIGNFRKLLQTQGWPTEGSLSPAAVVLRYVVPTILELAGLRTFDVEDANGALAIGELLRLYRECHARLGDDLLQYMRNTYLPANLSNPQFIDPVIHTLFLESDSKKQRSILKELFRG